MIRSFVWLALLAAGAVSAQDAAPAQSAPEAAAAAPAVSISDAYKREYALLEAQKRELSGRLAEIRTQMAGERQRREAELAALEARALAARAEAERLSDALVQGEQAAAQAEDNASLLAATLEQSRSTLDGFGAQGLPAAEDGATPVAERLRQTFAVAASTLSGLSQVRRGPGAFFLADGTEVQGTVVRFGNIAVFGVAGEAAGALAPAGGGRFRLWSAPSADSARALAEGRTPAVLQAFVFENAATAVSEPEAKTVAGEVEKGGPIGYLIVALGLLALVLVGARAVFLQRAGNRIQDIIEGAAPHVRSGRIDDAIAACKRFKGSAARVVTAALRNLDRDREHLEDIVSESILHESSHLNRFGAFITVVAAVAPLLGLLGTVTGMIQTFDVITEFGTSDPKLLSGGIAVALVTTELGLIVAIPLLLLGSLLNGWAERLKDDMEKGALKIINLAADVRGAAKAVG